MGPPEKRANDISLPARAFAAAALGCCLLVAGCGGSGGGDAPPPAGNGPDDDPPAAGLAQRPDNPACVAPPRPSSGAAVVDYDPYPASPGFNGITKFLQAPGDGTRWFVLEKAGRIRVFAVADPGNPRTWLDLTGRVRSDGGEEGLLGLAFHPDFPARAEIYVNYVAGATSGERESRISRLVLDDTDDPQNVTEQVLITIDQFASNHNGGDIAFGPDGYLYIGLGDGGGAGDPRETGQNTTNLLGAMLRIDVLDVPYPSPGYRIPPDNPFAAEANCGPTRTNPGDCPEIYAWGLRNPWRWSFDAPTGQLWLGDVGQDAREEVNLIERGGNYGWDCREGLAAFESTGCPAGGFTEPVIDYAHDSGDGRSITGGFVYRGTALPALQGRYVFGDFATGRIWALAGDGQGGYAKELLEDTSASISSFALDQDGEIYFADYFGKILSLRLEQPGGGADTIPDDLADTGCVDPADPTQPAAGLVPYAPNAPFWSDRAEKFRWIALPDGTAIDIDANDDFDFPNGTVIVKSFALDGQLIETRLLMRHPDGVWAGYTYAWNDAGTAATRVRGGALRPVNGQTWIYPSEAECLQCHTSAAGFALGPETAQLNGTLTYPSTGISANQLATLEHIGYFAAPLPAPVDALPAMPDPADAGAPLADRARAYLHTNCSQCHRPGGPTPSAMDLRYDTALADTATCGVLPAGGSLGLGGGARLIAPGNAALSVLPARMNRRDVKGMPPLGSDRVDSAGVALIDSWIDSLQNCN